LVSNLGVNFSRSFPVVRWHIILPLRHSQRWGGGSRLPVTILRDVSAARSQNWHAAGRLCEEASDGAGALCDSGRWSGLWAWLNGRAANTRVNASLPYLRDLA